MSSRPWMKFFPRDWRGDQALRSVSIAARGLWMECLCLMHEAKPYGHLLLNGEPIEDGALARMTGTSADELRQLTAELRQAGVLSLTRTGVIFSRRMIKDFARAQKGSKAAGKRWAQMSENKDEKDRPNRPPIRPPNTQKPESISQKERKQNSLGPPKAGRAGEAFERFWAEYPKRAGDNPKAPARQQFEALVRSGADPEVIISGLRKAVVANRDKIGTPYIPQAKRWLRDRRFEDYADAQPSNGANGQEPLQADLERTWRGLLDYEARHGSWSSTRIQRSTIPAKFIARWKQERAGSSAPELKLTA